MKAIEAVVLHNSTENHDKIYVLAHVNDDGMHKVVAWWGKNGSRLNSQEKVSGSMSQCVAKFNKIIYEKKNKGYVDVCSPEYVGDVHFGTVLSNLGIQLDEGDTGFDKEPEDKNSSDEEFVVECVDNSGYEYHFDVGVEYVASKVRKDVLSVYTKNGEKYEMLSFRFERV